MLIDVSVAGVKAVNEQPEDGEHTVQVCERLKEETEDWLGYRALAAGTESEERKTCYANIAEQEFQHMLVALGDLLDCVNRTVTEEERASLNSFFTQCIKPV